MQYAACEWTLRAVLRVLHFPAVWLKCWLASFVRSSLSLPRFHQLTFRAIGSIISCTENDVSLAGVLPDLFLLPDFSNSCSRRRAWPVGRWVGRPAVVFSPPIHPFRSGSFLLCMHRGAAVVLHLHNCFIDLTLLRYGNSQESLIVLLVLMIVSIQNGSMLQWLLLPFTSDWLVATLCNIWWVEYLAWCGHFVYIEETTLLFQPPYYQQTVILLDLPINLGFFIHVAICMQVLWVLYKLRYLFEYSQIAKFLKQDLVMQDLCTPLLHYRHFT